MSKHPDTELRLERRYDAPAERVFAAWTDPALARRWRSTAAHGEFLALDPPRRLSMRFAMPGLAQDSDVLTVEIVADGEGGSLMRFAQSGPGIARELAKAPAGQDSESAAGWRGMFDNLAGVLASQGGHGREEAEGTVRFERLLPGPIERVWRWIADSDKRAQWLAPGELPTAPGQSFELVFDNARLSPHTAPIPERLRKYEGIFHSRHEVLRLDPPRLLAMTWGGGKEPPSEVVFELTPEGDRTRLTITHTRLKDQATRLDVSGGWHAHLAVLTERLAGRTPPAFLAMVAAIEDDYAQREPRHP
ncbi:SRPBCC domain-containing protein [Pigmentiphaga sp. H8]|uniref:SRPBCC domain-containing protein n=1 Tax=Pigmentiphaga sp. H8 TaxID=2488560 RepID=UPI0013760622|nr:SRPBCC domain-containing protein [Pigmentiphaga sp. H8]